VLGSGSSSRLGPPGFQRTCSPAPAHLSAPGRRALVGFRGLAECRGRKLAPSLVPAQPPLPFGGFGGLPFRPALLTAPLARGRRSDQPEAPLTGSRAPSGHYREFTAGLRSGWSSRAPPCGRCDRQPSWASVPFSACGAGGPVHAGLPHPPPSALRVRALSAVCSPRYLAGRVSARQRSWASTFKAFLRAEVGDPLGPLVLSCRFPTRPIGSRHARGRFQRVDPPAQPYHTGRCR
jgi:hypothetical protein